MWGALLPTVEQKLKSSRTPHVCADAISLITSSRNKQKDTDSTVAPLPLTAIKPIIFRSSYCQVLCRITWNLNRKTAKAIESNSDLCIGRCSKNATR